MTDLSHGLGGKMGSESEWEAEEAEEEDEQVETPEGDIEETCGKKKSSFLMQIRAARLEREPREAAEAEMLEKWGNNVVEILNNPEKKTFFFRNHQIVWRGGKAEEELDAEERCRRVANGLKNPLHKKMFLNATMEL